jgi:retinol-binding protein 3
MQFIANTDSVILDLRDNGGGEPEMVAYLSSYLFPGPIHLNDLWNRANSTTRQYWTLPYVPGTRLSDKPVFVLTSSRTFSAAEEFAYNLQALKRASIVGETTGGGAHPVAGFPLVDRFMITVPVARAVNPVTGKNWEGTGVQPDVNAARQTR